MKGTRVILFTLVLVGAVCLLWFGSRQFMVPKDKSRDGQSIESAARTNWLDRVAKPLSWQDVESEDYRQYVANLRGTGCPESTVEDIVIADVNALFLRKAQPVLESIRNTFFQYYTSPKGTAGKKAILANANASLQPLDHQRLELIRTALGGTPEKFKTANAPWAFMVEEIAANEFPYLSPEKSAKLAALRKTVQDKIDQRIPPGSGAGKDGASFLEEMRKLLLAQVAELLTPAEMENYLVHNSEEAVELNHKLKHLSVTDAEFRVLLHSLREYYQDGYYDKPFTREADSMLGREFEKTLGQERYAKYVRENDFSYQKIRSFSDQSALSEEQAVRLYETRKQLEREAQSATIFGLDEEARAKKVLEAVGTAEASISQILNEPELRNRFLEAPAGSWLKWYRTNPGKPVQSVRPTVGFIGRAPNRD